MSTLLSINEVTPRFCSVAALVLLQCATLFGQSPQRPIEEVRTFEILVSGKPAGTSSIRILEAADGLTTASTDVAVSLSYIVYKYLYEFHGREVWQGNRLLSAQDVAVDCGKNLKVSGPVDTQRSAIQTNDKNPVSGPILAMTTNYWHAPEGQKGSSLNVLDADQGTVHAMRIENITVEQLAVDGKQIACAHYRLSGDLDADLWFDPQQRLVRQQTTEEGRPVELRLARIHTNGSPVASR